MSPLKVKPAKPSTSRNSINTLQGIGAPAALRSAVHQRSQYAEIENGFDFYEEVSRFEIELINRALLQTGGHQVRAAKF